MTKVKKATIEKKGAKVSPFKIYWTKTNYLLFGLGFIILVLGYFLLSRDPWDGFTSLTLSPIILMIAYLVIFPLAILFIHKKKS